MYLNLCHIESILTNPQIAVFTGYIGSCIPIGRNNSYTYIRLEGIHKCTGGLCFTLVFLQVVGRLLNLDHGVYSVDYCSEKHMMAIAAGLKVYTTYTAPSSQTFLTQED